jgi:hypothetical protein
MLSKGFLDHYDIVAFIGGDDDFRDLVYAVKNLVGKRIFGCYFSHNATKEMRESFDVEIVLSEVKVKRFIDKSLSAF